MLNTDKLYCAFFHNSKHFVVITNNTNEKLKQRKLVQMAVLSLKSDICQITLIYKKYSFIFVTCHVKNKSDLSGTYKHVLAKDYDTTLYKFDSNKIRHVLLISSGKDGID